MEEYQNRATAINKNQGALRMASTQSTDAKSMFMNEEQQQTILAQRRQKLVNDVYAYIRDAGATENLRAIQDSDSPVALQQKKMVKQLVDQGWSKNEIIYEQQRIFGNDVLINTAVLDDERSFLGKYGMPFLSATMLMSLYVMRKTRAANSLAQEQMKKQALKDKLKAQMKAKKL